MAMREPAEVGDTLATLVARAPAFEDTAITSVSDIASDVPPDLAPAKRIIWSLHDLLSEHFPKPEPLVAGLVDRGDAASLFGSGGSGKSWLALALSLAVATGTPWLGHFACALARVLYIDQEGRVEKVQERLLRLSAHVPITPETPLVYARTSGLRVDNDVGFAQLRSLIAEHSPDLVILDSLTRFHSKEENVAHEMAYVAQRLAELTTDQGIASLTIDHANKSGLSEDPRARLRGSSDKLNALDSAWMVDRALGSTTLNVTPVKARYDEELPPFVVSVEHFAGATTLRYEDAGAANVSPEDVLAAIRRLSAAEPYGATVDAIATAVFSTSALTTKQREHRVRVLLKKLEQQERVYRVDVPREGARGGRKHAYRERGT